MRIPILLFTYFILLFTACSPHKYCIENNLRENTKVVQSEGDPTILPILAKYKDSMYATTSRVIGLSMGKMTKEKPNCSLSNLFGDAMMAYARKHNIEADAAIANYGGIRLNAIAEGAITVGKIYELSPFENFFTVVTIKGEILEQWCNLIADKGGDPIANISFQIKDKKAYQISINNTPLDKEKIYRICTNDYLAMGNDGCTFLKDKQNKVYTVTIRDCIIDFIAQQKTFIPNNNKPIQ